MTPLDTLISTLDIIGVGVCALSGALEASRRQMDIIGFMMIAAVAGIGGGTVRDLLLGLPVFWVHTPMFLELCAGIAVAVFFLAHIFESRYKVLLWADAVGMSVFCIIGTEKALLAGAPYSVAILMGMITATFGGVVRDILCNEIPLILRREIYASAAAVGASVYVLLHHFDMPRVITVIATLMIAFSIRAIAILYALSLPTYRSRPGRKIS